MSVALNPECLAVKRRRIESLNYIQRLPNDLLDLIFTYLYSNSYGGDRKSFYPVYRQGQTIRVFDANLAAVSKKFKALHDSFIEGLEEFYLNPKKSDLLLPPTSARRLKILHLGDLDNSDLKALTCFRDLRVLSFETMTCTEEIIPYIQSFQELETLKITDTSENLAELSNSFLHSLAHLPRLKRLTLKGFPCITLNTKNPIFAQLKIESSFPFLKRLEFCLIQPTV